MHNIIFIIVPSREPRAPATNQPERKGGSSFHPPRLPPPNYPHGRLKPDLRSAFSPWLRRRRRRRSWMGTWGVSGGEGEARGGHLEGGIRRVRLAVGGLGHAAGPLATGSVGRHVRGGGEVAVEHRAAQRRLVDRRRVGDRAGVGVGLGLGLGLGLGFGSGLCSGAFPGRRGAPLPPSAPRLRLRRRRTTRKSAHAHAPGQG